MTNLNVRNDLKSKKSVCLDFEGVVCDIVGGVCYEKDRPDPSDFDRYSDHYYEWFAGSDLNNLDENSDEIRDQFYSDYLFWKNLKPFVSSWYAINQWWSKGYDIFLLTSVSEIWVSEWLDMWKLQWSQLISCYDYPKMNVVSDNSFDLVVLNNPDDVASARRFGVNAFLYRAWYNSPYWDHVDSVGSLMEDSLSGF